MDSSFGNASSRQVVAISFSGDSLDDDKNVTAGVKLDGKAAGVALRQSRCSDVVGDVPTQG